MQGVLRASLLVTFRLAQRRRAKARAQGPPRRGRGAPLKRSGFGKALKDAERAAWLCSWLQAQVKGHGGGHRDGDRDGLRRRDRVQPEVPLAFSKGCSC